MTLLERLIKEYEQFEKETDDYREILQIKLKALMDFSSGKELTDRQEELVKEILWDYRKGLESDLKKVDEEVDLNMEFAQHLQQSIDEIDREMEKLDDGRIPYTEFGLNQRRYNVI